MQFLFRKNILHRPQKALSPIARMAKNGFSTSHTSIAMKSELTQEEISKLEKMKDELYYLASRNVKKRNVAQIKSALEDMHKSFKPCIHVFNIELKTQIMLNDSHSIKAVIDAFAAHGLKPNNITYNLLITYYRNNGRINDALRLFEKMRSSGLSPDRFAYTTLISGMAKKGRIQEAEKLFEEMKCNPNIHTDVQAYNAMLLAYLKVNQLEKVQELLESFSKLGIQEDFVTYKMKVIFYILRNQPEKAMSIFLESIKPFKGAEADDFLELVRHFLFKGHLMQALDIFSLVLEIFGASEECIKLGY